MTPADETAEDTPEPTPQTFTDLGVIASITEALAAKSIVNPFPIQAMAIPIALTGTDMIGQARTGTGKTLAFGITMLQRTVAPADPEFDQLAKPGAPQGLVVCPTRELASQVGKDLDVAARLRGSRVLTVYGGVGYDPQLDALKAGVEIVVGTPGRLLDLADRRVLDLSHIKVMVLDEADEMLDLGFLPDVERLLAKTPELRQTMLFSATMPAAIVSLARTHLRHPVNIRAESAGDTTTVPATAQFVYQAHDLDKPEVVARILQADDRNRAMIFCRTKRAAQRVADDLAERGFKAASIHGDLSQIAREKSLQKFREGGIDVLVATDVAARGIDVTGVSHVINYECPDDDKAYVHRIGRTGRAGATGIAITFVDWADRTKWKVINNVLGLPFEEPQETYSTSAHLYHDLGIEPGVTGRVAPPQPAPDRPRERGGRDDRGRDRDRDRGKGRSGPRGELPRAESKAVEITAETTEGRADQPRRKRSDRKRKRNGVTVDGAVTSASTDTAPTGPAPGQAAPAPLAPEQAVPAPSAPEQAAPVRDAASGSAPAHAAEATSRPGSTESAPTRRTVTTTMDSHANDDRESSGAPRKRRRSRGRGRRDAESTAGSTSGSSGSGPGGDERTSDAG
ncbi:MAG: DEAD/DEAH box helicase [Propionibacteriaceae bacterium]